MVNNGSSNHNYVSSLYTMVVIHETGDDNPLEDTLETNTEHTLPVFHCPSLLTSTETIIVFPRTISEFHSLQL